VTIATMVTWVSVVVPVRHSPGTTRKTVDALLKQTYRGPVEIVVVGDRDDPVWDVVRDEIDAGQVQIVEVSSPNPSFRRNAGLSAATGDVLCLPDCDVVPACDWVSTGVALLGDRWRCVAGPMASTVCFTREVYERVGGFDPRHAFLHQDREWFARMVHAGYNFLCTPLLVAYDERSGRRDAHEGRRRASARAPIRASSRARGCPTRGRG
jgi:glycosyltransferase involved in cell wall biosynthesis